LVSSLTIRVSPFFSTYFVNGMSTFRFANACADADVPAGVAVRGVGGVDGRFARRQRLVGRFSLRRGAPLTHRSHLSDTDVSANSTAHSPPRRHEAHQATNHDRSPQALSKDTAASTYSAPKACRSTDVLCLNDRHSPDDCHMYRSVMSLHGIRTRGVWQKDLVPVLARQGWSRGRSTTATSGRQVPAKRRPPQEVTWLRSEYERVTAEGKVNRPSIIAHSFGTYLVAALLIKYPDSSSTRSS
jgi:hypothetical protein